MEQPNQEGRDQEVRRYLTLLETKMRQRNHTQLQVQTAMSWGRSYVSQLKNGQKKLRVEQLLAILDVIGVDPREFFAELYDLELGTFDSVAQLKREVKELRAQVGHLLQVLVRNKVITAKERSRIAA